MVAVRMGFLLSLGTWDRMRSFILALPGTPCDFFIISLEEGAVLFLVPFGNSDDFYDAAQTLY